MLHFAADRGNVEVVLALLEAGAEVDATEPEAEQTPLTYACAGNHLDVAEALVRAGADLHHKDADGCDPLSVLANDSDRAQLLRVRI